MKTQSAVQLEWKGLKLKASIVESKPDGGLPPREQPRMAGGWAMKVLFLVAVVAVATLFGLRLRMAGHWVQSGSMEFTSSPSTESEEPRHIAPAR